MTTETTNTQKKNPCDDWDWTKITNEFLEEVKTNHEDLNRLDKEIKKIVKMGEKTTKKINSFLKKCEKKEKKEQSKNV